MILPPGSTIGIVGGGQLGRMTALAAARLGYRCHVLDPDPDGPAAQVAAAVTAAAHDDPEALVRFGDAVDVVTIEFENLPVPALARLAERLPVRPAPGVLAICQDRVEEKAFLRRIGAPTTAFAVLEDPGDLARALAGFGDAVLKPARFGYDGKGQTRLRAGDDAGAAWAALAAPRGLLERHVDFGLEISVITARGSGGACRSYAPVANRHEAHILTETVAPAPIPLRLADEAVRLAEHVAEALDIVGLLAVEMFVTREGGLLVNELAPRPHNSGHWTLDACAVSQFEQLVRAICGLPLGDPARLSDARMENLLGEQALRFAELLAEPGARLHLYGKRSLRPGRKMGHVTRLSPPR